LKRRNKMARNKIEMNITEEKAYNLVCKKESLGSLEFELLQLYLSICVVITVTLIVLFLTSINKKSSYFYK